MNLVPLQARLPVLISSVSARLTPTVSPNVIPSVSPSSTDEASVQMKCVFDGRVIGERMRSKNGISTLPVPAVAVATEHPAFLQSPPPEDEYIPAAKAKAKTASTY